MNKNKNVCPFDFSSSINQPSTFLRICVVPFNAMFWISSAMGFPGINSISLLKLSLTVPNAPTTTATTFVLTFHILEISICRSLNFNLISVSFSTHLLSSGTAISIIKQFCSGLLSQACLRESVNIVLSHIMTLSSNFVTFSSSCI